MPRITWAGPPPHDAADFEGVLREFAITLCPPRARAQVCGDGWVEVLLDIRPSPGALSFGNRSREHQVYVASVCGTLSLRVGTPAELRTALEAHYKIETARLLEESGAA
jgi:hypothetical protein